MRCNPMTTIEQTVCTGVRKLRAFTQGFQWATLEGCTAVALMAEHDDARQARPMTTIEQAVCTCERNLRVGTRISLRPIPQWAALEG